MKVQHVRMLGSQPLACLKHIFFVSHHGVDDIKCIQLTFPAVDSHLTSAAFALAALAQAPLSLRQHGQLTKHEKMSEGVKSHLFWSSEAVIEI